MNAEKYAIIVKIKVPEAPYVTMMTAIPYVRFAKYGIAEYAKNLVIPHINVKIFVDTANKKMFCKNYQV